MTAANAARAAFREMTKRRLYASSLLLLLATAPWWFGSSDSTLLLGLPRWAVYSLGMTLLYAGCLARWLEAHWELSAGPDTPTERGDGDGD